MGRDRLRSRGAQAASSHATDFYGNDKVTSLTLDAPCRVSLLHEAATFHAPPATAVTTRQVSCLAAAHLVDLRRSAPLGRSARQRRRPPGAGLGQPRLPLGLLVGPPLPLDAPGRRRGRQKRTWRAAR